MLADMMSKLRSGLEHVLVEEHYFTDSTIAMCWCSNMTLKLKMYVRSRVVVSPAKNGVAQRAAARIVNAPETRPATRERHPELRNATHTLPRLTNHLRLNPKKHTHAPTRTTKSRHGARARRKKQLHGVAAR